MSSVALKFRGELSKLPAWIRCVVCKAEPMASCHRDSDWASAAGVQVVGLVAMGKEV